MFMKLIVGLGNPGKEYEATRHNIGFKVIDAFAHKHNLNLNKSKYTGKFYKGDGIILAKPETFMNESGNFVQPMAKFFKVDLEDILIIYDDMDIPAGKARMKKTGSAGGQNGMKDIIMRMGTNDIPRLKVGIGRPKHGSKNHVIGTFSPMQTQSLDNIKSNLIQAIEDFIDFDFAKSALNLNTNTK